VRNLLTLWNVYSFVTYALVDRWRPSDGSDGSDGSTDRRLTGGFSRGYTLIRG
jgi:hypothetical protein